MKHIKSLILLAAGSLAVSAPAQSEFTLTGSTAFRSITFDRVANYLMAPGYTTEWGTNATMGILLTNYIGTLSANVPGYAGQAVKIYASFSGSGEGMLAVANGDLIPVATANYASNWTRVPDMSLSDVQPESSNPPLDSSFFDSVTNLGIVNFIWGANNAIGLTNLTREEARLVLKASGPGLTGKQIGGTYTGNIYLVGRTNNSGTRITTEAVMDYTGDEQTWVKSGSTWVPNGPGAGFFSGGNVASMVNKNADAIGYMGFADYAGNASATTALAYNGVPYSIANITNGLYAIWGYEKAVAAPGLKSRNIQWAIYNALVAGIRDNGFQHNTSLPYAKPAGITGIAPFTPYNDMTVHRNNDGGLILPGPLP